MEIPVEIPNQSPEVLEEGSCYFGEVRRICLRSVVRHLVQKYPISFVRRHLPVRAGHRMVNLTEVATGWNLVLGTNQGIPS